MILLALAAFIPLVLGTAHLVFTYFGPNLRPRPAEVETAMRGARLVITGETTLWRAYIGFNVTHSMSLMLFGLVYGYLALWRPEVMAGSDFLQGLGLLTLLVFCLLAKLYFFSVPSRGVNLALALFALGLLLVRR